MEVSNCNRQTSTLRKNRKTNVLPQASARRTSNHKSFSSPGEAEFYSSDTDFNLFSNIRPSSDSDNSYLVDSTDANSVSEDSDTSARNYGSKKNAAELPNKGRDSRERRSSSLLKQWSDMEENLDNEMYERNRKHDVKDLKAGSDCNYSSDSSDSNESGQHRSEKQESQKSDRRQKNTPRGDANRNNRQRDRDASSESDESWEPGLAHVLSRMSVRYNSPTPTLRGILKKNKAEDDDTFEESGSSGSDEQTYDNDHTFDESSSSSPESDEQNYRNDYSFDEPSSYESDEQYYRQKHGNESSELSEASSSSDNDSVLFERSEYGRPEFRTRGNTSSTRNMACDSLKGNRNIFHRREKRTQRRIDEVLNRRSEDKSKRCKRKCKKSTRDSKKDNRRCRRNGRNKDTCGKRGRSNLEIVEKEVKESKCRGKDKGRRCAKRCRKCGKCKSRGRK